MVKILLSLRSFLTSNSRLGMVWRKQGKGRGVSEEKSDLGSPRKKRGTKTYPRKRRKALYDALGEVLGREAEGKTKRDG